MNLDATSRETWAPTLASPTVVQVAASTPTQFVRRADFLACVYRCVSRLATTSATSTIFDSDRAQLRRWLQAQSYVLEDGTPVDFKLFDAAILGAEERLPQPDAHAQMRLLHASRVLAEAIYAGK